MIPSQQVVRGAVFSLNIMLSIQTCLNTHLEMGNRGKEATFLDSMRCGIFQISR